MRKVINYIFYIFILSLHHRNLIWYINFTCVQWTPVLSDAPWRSVALVRFYSINTLYAAPRPMGYYGHILSISMIHLPSWDEYHRMVACLMPFQVLWFLWKYNGISKIYLPTMSIFYIWYSFDILIYWTTHIWNIISLKFSKKW